MINGQNGHEKVIDAEHTSHSNCRWFKVVRPRYWKIPKLIINLRTDFPFRSHLLTLYALPLGLAVVDSWTNLISVHFPRKKTKQISGWFILCRGLLLTCIVVSPVASANSRFSRGDGYGLCAYHSRKIDRDFSCQSQTQTVSFPNLEKSGIILKNYFETVAGLFAIPDCVRQWKFASDPVFSDRSKCSASLFFRFHVVRFQPECL